MSTQVNHEMLDSKSPLGVDILPRSSRHEESGFHLHSISAGWVLLVQHHLGA